MINPAMAQPGKKIALTCVWRAPYRAKCADIPSKSRRRLASSRPLHTVRLVVPIPGDSLKNPTKRRMTSNLGRNGSISESHHDTFFDWRLKISRTYSRLTSQEAPLARPSRRKFLGAAAACAAAPLGMPGRQAAGCTEDNSSIGKTPHTRFAVNIEMWFTQLPFLKRIEAAAALGFPAVEFWPLQGKDL